MTDDIIEQAAQVLCETAGARPGHETHRDDEPCREDHAEDARALADAGLLRQEPPTREEIADELAGWPIGSGYYASSVLVDDAQDMADAVLELLKGRKR